MSESQWTTAREMYAEGFSPTDIAEELGVDVAVMWNSLEKLKQRATA
jgi:uncharacterized protein YjcR